jgi:uncharacterized protein YndB with AHSA1/START domain
MSLVHEKITIEAPPQRVWETVMDPNRLGEWVTIHRAIRDVPPRPPKAGATMEQVLQVRGFRFHVHWTLVSVEEPTAAEWEGRGPAYSRARIRYQLSGDGDGPTEFEYTNEFSPPGGRLGTVASRMIVGAASEREARNSLTRLKALLERG